jgi:hypothetical protein
MELFLLLAFTHLASFFLPDHLRRLAFPDPIPSPVARSRDFHHASGTIQPSDY